MYRVFHKYGYHFVKLVNYSRLELIKKVRVYMLEEGHKFYWPLDWIQFFMELAIVFKINPQFRDIQIFLAKF